MMDFAALPPEINSGRIYAGPGSGSMLAAAAAWDSLATELRSTAASFSSAISGLTVEWQGASSSAMMAAVEPYIAWLNTTAEQAEQTGSQAEIAAAAYQTAVAAVVPPPAIAANRSLLSALVATNIAGQNTAAIAATEAAYGEMWVQDAAAMYLYAESSSSAAQLSDFEQPPAIARQQYRVPNSDVAASAGGAKSAFQTIPAPPSTLQNAAAAAAAPTDADIAGIQNLAALVSQVQAVGVVSVIIGLGIAAGDLGAAVDAAAAAGPGPAIAAVPESGALATASAERTIAAEVGEARMVGSLSVPPGWATATPTVRLAAAALSGISTPTAEVAASLDSAIGQMALASVAGNALSGASSANVRGPAAQKSRPVSSDDSETPDKLKRVLSQLAQEPESVQHWHTDKAHLDSLLDQLSNRPGIHTVHVSKKPRFTTRPSGPF